MRRDMNQNQIRCVPDGIASLYISAYTHCPYIRMISVAEVVTQRRDESFYVRGRTRQPMTYFALSSDPFEFMKGKL